MADFTPTSLTRSKAELLSGGLGMPASIAGTDFAEFETACEIRLRAMLCMTDGVADTDPNYEAWLMLLSNWVKAVYAAARVGVSPVASKAVRNFSVSNGNEGKPDLSTFYTSFIDLIGLFSQCDAGVAFQSDWVSIIYGPDQLQIGDLMPDMPPLFGGAV